MLKRVHSGPATIEGLAAETKAIRGSVNLIMRAIIKDEARSKVPPVLKDFSMLPFANKNITGSIRRDLRLKNLNEIFAFETLLDDSGQARDQFVSDYFFRFILDEKIFSFSFANSLNILQLKLKIE